MTNQKKVKRLAVWLLFSSLGLSPQAFAHGANIVYQQTEAITVRATYDDGKPMSNAQVVIYAPDNPTTPWLKGTTNEQGKFTFVPSSPISGNWDIKIRQSGHGGIISIPWQVTKPTASVGLLHNSSNVNRHSLPGSSNYTLIQKVIMAATGIWGFVGTALFFARQKSSS